MNLLSDTYFTAMMCSQKEDALPVIRLLFYPLLFSPFYFTRTT